MPIIYPATFYVIQIDFEWDRVFIINMTICR